MKVLHVYAGAEHGGAEIFAEDCIVALAESGLEQTIITRPFERRVDRLSASGATVIPFAFSGIGARLRGQRLIRQVARDVGVDLVQSWMGRAASVTPKLDCPVVGWFGGYYDLKRYRNADFLVGVTRDIREHFVSSGASEDRSVCIHTFSALEPDPPIDRSDFQTPDGAPVLLVLSRLHQKKGIDVMLEAAARVPDAYLWIAGAGELEHTLKAHCTTLGLDDRVRFLGWRTDRKALLDAADICVLPSRYEPFGTVMAEAWEAGVPLIAARAAGPNVYLEDGVDGLLVDIDDVDGLTAAVRRCIDDAELRKTLVTGGTTKFREQFSKEIIVKHYRELYARVLAEQGRDHNG